MRNLRIAEMLFNRPLMISESKLNVILHILGPRLNLDLGGLPSQQLAEISDQDRARAGYQVKGNIGIVGIHGPLMHRRLASQFPSGGPTTYGEIRRAFDMAMADDAVESIILDIDSPGGEVSGVFDLADHIYQARSSKPSTAILNESAFSAGYLLASSAGRIVMPRTGGAGSIGVIATHADFSRAEDAAGITVTHVIAGAKKADFSPHHPLSESALASLQAMVDDSYEMFVDTVARNRGMTTKAVRDTEAGIFEGKKAVAARLADEISAVDKAIAQAGMARGKTMLPTSARAVAGKENRAMTLLELREKHPDLVAQIETEASAGMITQAAADTARAEAVTAESTRVMSLVQAAIGEEGAGKIRAAADKGLTADDLQALGVSLAPVATGDADLATRNAMLEGITGAAPAALRTGNAVTGEAAEEQVVTNAILAGAAGRRQ
ncbi:MAG: S49 family peptidase [Pedobacter sp.]